MRQEHRAGEKLFIDYSGRKASVVDPSTGEVREVEIYVAVLGASSYVYAEATWTQKLADFVGSTTRALAFLGGVPGALVIDNLKAGVTKADRYEGDVNRTYEEMARHYSTVVLPARPYKPKDKGYASYCASSVGFAASSRRRRLYSEMPLCFLTTGASPPGDSYRC
jgi:transposase